MALISVYFQMLWERSQFVVIHFQCVDGHLLSQSTVWWCTPGASSCVSYISLKWLMVEPSGCMYTMNRRVERLHDRLTEMVQDHRGWRHGLG